MLRFFGELEFLFFFGYGKVAGHDYVAILVNKTQVEHPTCPGGKSILVRTGRHTYCIDLRHPFCDGRFRNDFCVHFGHREAFPTANAAKGVPTTEHPDFISPLLLLQPTTFPSPFSVSSLQATALHLFMILEAPRLCQQKVDPDAPSPH